MQRTAYLPSGLSKVLCFPAGAWPTGAYHLTPLERRLLQTFMLHPSQVIPRSRLMKEVWETDYLDDIRTLHVHICWLRHKVEEDSSNPRRIITHRGLGYELHVSDTPPSQ